MRLESWNEARVLGMRLRYLIWSNPMILQREPRIGTALSIYTESYFLPLFQGPSFWPEPALGGSHVPLLMSPAAWGCPCEDECEKPAHTHFPPSTIQPHPPSLLTVPPTHTSQLPPHSHALPSYQPTSFATSAHGTQLHPSHPPPTHSLFPSQPPTLTASHTYSLSS